MHGQETYLADRMGNCLYINVELFHLHNSCICKQHVNNILICDNDIVRKIKRPHPLLGVLEWLANFDIHCRWQIPLTTQKYPESTQCTCT